MHANPSMWSHENHYEALEFNGNATNMKLTTYTHPLHGIEPVAGVLQGDRVLNAGELLGHVQPMSMLDLLRDGPEVMVALALATTRFAEIHTDSVHVPRNVAVPSWESTMLAPITEPTSIRDFYAFEQHVGSGYKKRGREIPAAWFEVPVFYFAHTGNIFGPDDSIPKPLECAELDFELELAAIIGTPGRDIPAERAWEHIAGFTVMNDWSARDIQRQEMGVGLGPAKGKDFATSFGPVIVTIDEIKDRISGDSLDLRMTARVNDDEVSSDSTASMYWGFPKLIERASKHAELRPGDIIGSGTCGTGCILELGTDRLAWLQPGDEIELEVERIGKLRSVIR